MLGMDGCGKASLQDLWHSAATGVGGGCGFSGRAEPLGSVSHDQHFGYAAGVGKLPPPGFCNGEIGVPQWPQHMQTQSGYSVPQQGFGQGCYGGYSLGPGAADGMYAYQQQHVGMSQ